MYCVIKGHNFEHELQTIGQIFYKNQGFCRVDNIPVDGICIFSSFERSVLVCGLYVNGDMIVSSITEIIDTDSDSQELGFAIKDRMFKLLKDATGESTPWGSLTGIRPTKIMHKLLDDGLSEKESVRLMQDKYYVSSGKAELLSEIVGVQRCLAEKRSDNDVSLYIGIPFCPTRCHYCSFAAYSLDKYKKYTDDYLEALINEMNSLKKDVERLNIGTVYIGGGTPTSLNENQLEKLLFHIENTFCLDNADEYSVEAGRPDTITESKLELLKKYKVSRISINPQTLKHDTLKHIGRDHTPEQFFTAFELARNAGFDFINVDLIAGLPGETVSDFKKTLEKMHPFSPENLTIHTLAVKRASKFKEDILDNGVIFKSNEAAEMLNYAYEYAKSLNMNPYYLYRQKNMVDSLENVGYAKKGFECIYNIHIMEETETIIAFGAGAITKYVYHKENRIERSANAKDVLEYIKRNSETA